MCQILYILQYFIFINILRLFLYSVQVLSRFELGMKFTGKLHICRRKYYPIRYFI